MRRVPVLLSPGILIALFAVPGVARAQPLEPTPVQRVVAAHWRTVDGDSASLAALARASVDVGGGTVVRAMLEAVRRTDRPFEVRRQALTTLIDAVVPGARLPDSELDWVGGEPEADCQPTARWSPGDTLRVCHEIATYVKVLLPSLHPDYRLATSIEPPLRDTIRAVTRALSLSDPDPRVARVAAWLDQAAARFAGGDPLGLRPCPRPRSGSRPCLGAALPAPAARWRTVEGDSSSIALLRASQEVRDRRLQAVLKQVALDRSRPTRVRFAAMEALATLADPRMNTYGIRSWRKPGRWESEYEGCINWGWHAHHAVQWDGAVPMRPGSRGDVAVFLFGMANSKQPMSIRKQAYRLYRCVSMLGGRTHRPGP